MSNELYEEEIGKLRAERDALAKRLERVMSTELLEKAMWAASTARNRNGSESDAIAAAVRVAVEACAEEAKAAREHATATCGHRLPADIAPARLTAQEKEQQ